jgi:1,4-dihydroxy-2-naphthoate octaprenyltransferase
VATLSYKLGYTGTFVFCGIIYLCAWIFMAQFFIHKKEINKLWVISILFLPVIVYFINWFLQVRKNNAAANFKNTMKMNWIAAAFTNISFIILLIWNNFE